MVQAQAVNPIDAALGASGSDSTPTPPQINPIDAALGYTSETTPAETPGSISGLEGKPNSMQAVPSEQTPEGSAAALAQRQAQHPIITAIGEGAGGALSEVGSLIEGAVNPMASGALGAAKNVISHFEELPPIYREYEKARASGKGFGDAIAAANEEARRQQEAHDFLTERLKEFKDNPARGVGRAAIDLTTLVAPFVEEGGLPPMEDFPTIKDMVKAAVPQSSGGPAHEVAARNLAKAVNPQISEWPSYIRANADEGGNVVAHAMEKNRPLHTQLDYAKAARSGGDEARAVYKDKILNPVGDDIVAIDGTGYQGATVAGGQDATLRAIDRRITQINNEMRPGFIKTEQGKVMTAVANEAELKAEQGALTKLLHKELSARTGVPEEDIAAIRQRFGKMYTIADETEAAVNQRQSAVSRQKEGRRDVPVTATSAGVDIFNRVVRGGPEGIANRAFRKTLFDLSEIPTNDLPKIEPKIKSVQERAALTAKSQELRKSLQSNPSALREAAAKTPHAVPEAKATRNKAYHGSQNLAAFTKDE